jgi:aryl-alcohol dehydrogenase-like predicted oxidoreductase
MAHQTLDAAAAGSFTIGGDLPVHRLGFGAMRVTGPGVWGPPRHREEAKHVLRRALELGVTLIDTADSYGPNVSEELIADALHPYPQGLVIATKGGLLRGGPGDWRPDGRPEHLRAALEGSLQRLRLDRIDVYQLHRPDPKVPYAESVGVLAELRAAGKIRHVGLSNVSVAQLEEARRIVPIVSVQNRYNLDDRSSEDVLQHCRREGIAFLPWAPVGGGTSSTRPRLEAVARAHSATITQITLAWLLQRAPVVCPIPGTSSIAHLDENIAATAITLTDEELAHLGR